MPQRPDFDLTAESLVPIMDSAGVMEIGSDDKEAFLGVYYDTSADFFGIYVVYTSSGVQYYEVRLEDVATVGFTGNYLFVSEGKEYVARKFVEADGEWMSEYKIELPVEVLYRMAISASSDTIESLINLKMPSSLPEYEALYVYYDEQTRLIVSLVYLSSFGTYARVDGDWVEDDISLPSYQNMLTFEVDSERATELIDMFDEKMGAVSYNDAIKFKAANPEGARSNG